MVEIAGGATLEVDSSATSTLTTTFGTGAGTLALRAPTKFLSKISGFSVGDTIDLLGLQATGASINAKDQLVIVNATKTGSKTVATLQLSGTYSGATFSTGTDSNGGTKVTMLTAASVPGAASPHVLIASMASMGESAATATSSSAWSPANVANQTLVVPRGY